MNALHTHHPLHALHNEMVAVRHWFNINMLHDYHVWLALLIGALILGFTLLMVAYWGRGAVLNKELLYYVQSYGPL